MNQFKPWQPGQSLTDPEEISDYDYGLMAYSLEGMLKIADLVDMYIWDAIHYLDA